ncbi:hypothetical protein EYF80_037805 [Liparis tanakae]|uniref:Uncharacterized protein n=1 Tax=Liparis tanakae TaxID=230148 RepID=A0A4Z2GF33_9TELE|nr:hypothetical protein EYF80_037805 [Liparis tanakae]
MSKVNSTAMSPASPRAAASFSGLSPTPLNTSPSQTRLLFSFSSVPVSPITLTLRAPGTLTLKRTQARASSRPARGSNSTQPFPHAEYTPGNGAPGRSQLFLRTKSHMGLKSPPGATLAYRPSRYTPASGRLTLTVTLLSVYVLKSWRASGAPGGSPASRPSTACSSRSRWLWKVTLHLPCWVLTSAVAWLNLDSPASSVRVPGPHAEPRSGGYSSPGATTFPSQRSRKFPAFWNLASVFS